MATFKPQRYPMNLTGWIPNVYEIIPGKPRFGTLTTMIKDLQRELSAGNLKSVDIVKEYYRSIFSYNGYLNAIYELAQRPSNKQRHWIDCAQKGRF
jgi:hypothetical protein